MPGRDFDFIYAEYSRLVYWTAYGVVKNQADALDVSQNAFLRVLKHMDKLRAMSDPQLKGWLYRVTVNLCIDDKRKRSRELLSDDGELPDVADYDESVLPEPSAMTASTRETVRAAVDALPRAYREAVLLHYYSGLEYAEIASLTGAAEGTIKSRIFRAKAKLCTLLKEGESIG